MDVSVESLSSLGRRLTVSVPADRYESEVRERLRQIARSAQIKGFRRGKIPARIVEQRWGAQVRSEALGEIVRSSFNEAVRQQNLRPAAPPDIQTDGQPENGALRYTATFEVVPDFGVIDVSGLRVRRVSAQVSDADVDQMIETLRAQRRSFVPVSRPAQSGDMALVETYATAGDLRIPAAGSEQGGTLIGAGMLHADIESALIGMDEGEEKVITVTYPADWRIAELAGREASVWIKVTRVSEPVLPEVDAEFIASFGVRSGDLAQFRDEVRANLARELKGVLSAQLRDEVVDKLVAAFGEVELPQGLIENELRSLTKQAEQQAQQQGRQVEIDPEAMRGVARRRVAAGLLLSEVARQQKLVLDGKRVDETLGLIASTYEDPVQVIDLYRNDEKLMAGLRSRVMEEQVIEWIADHAQADVISMSFNDVMRSGQQAI